MPSSPFPTQINRHRFLRPGTLTGSLFPLQDCGPAGRELEKLSRSCCVLEKQRNHNQCFWPKPFVEVTRGHPSPELQSGLPGSSCRETRPLSVHISLLNLPYTCTAGVVIVSAIRISQVERGSWVGEYLWLREDQEVGGCKLSPSENASATQTLPPFQPPGSGSCHDVPPPPPRLPK
ncbi:coiled-coil domain-containing protein 115 isoform X1 [Narcine bancroftii]|uniref:coiled-coil domain-containing protein 115 isoform X1 n=1 Tax=Narcine bancroftii TaxID=1343680 RepID=UPI003831DC94